MNNIFVNLRNPKKLELKKDKFFKIIGKILIVIVILLIFSKLYYWLEGKIYHIPDQYKHNWSKKFILFSIFFAPIFEEIAFRLPLKFKPFNLAISTSFIIFYITTNIIFKTPLLEINIHLLYSFLISVFFFIIFIFLLKLNKIKKLVEKIWENHFNTVFYFYAFLFGFTHFFKFIEPNLIFIFFYPLPFVIIGIFLGYFRLKYGFIYSIIFHFIYSLLNISVNILLLNL